MMKILVVDNYDSFVYNLVHYIDQLGDYEITVLRNDEINLEEVAKYDRILLSPGPGIPEEAGVMMDLIKKYVHQKPIFGVCLGHQAIAEAMGGVLENRKDVLHGIAHDLIVTDPNDALYKNLPQRFKIGRYHSWQVKKESIEEKFTITGLDDEGDVLSFKLKNYPVYGVQYHPESVLTENGLQIIQNWLQS